MPDTIGRYKVLGVGFGAMGAVYKAFDPLIKRTLAIKTIRLDIPRQSPQYRSFIDRFYHEARISGTLSHANIVTLFDIGEEDGVPYLAMEYVDGQTVAALIETGHRFKPERVISLASQIASAIDYAHGKGVIHRDIKPSNLILYEEDRVKVTDFGIAKLADAEMTQSGTLLGTPSYMSPEQAMGDKLDGRSDIFSLGVCCFEMLSGEQPFPGTNVTSILYKLVHVDPIEPADLEMHGLVPQKWHEVFGKALAKRPDDRYQTATAFVQDLEFCLGAWFGALGAGETVESEAIPPTLPMHVPPEDETPVTVVMKAAVASEPQTVITKPPVTPPPEPPTQEVRPPDAADQAVTVVMRAGEPVQPPPVSMRPAPSPPLPPAGAEEPQVTMTVKVPRPATASKPPLPAPGAGANDEPTLRVEATPTVRMAAPSTPALPLKAQPAAPAPPPAVSVPPPLPRPVPVVEPAPSPPPSTPLPPEGPLRGGSGSPRGS